MATVMNEWTREEMRSATHFLWAKGFQPVEMHRQLVTGYGPGVMALQHVRTWRRELGNGRVSVADEQRIARPSTSAERVDDIDAAVRADGHTSLVQLEQRLNLLHGTIWDIVHKRLGYRRLCSRWLPRQVENDRKKARMATSLTLLQ
jgi:hypothetical protein